MAAIIQSDIMGRQLKIFTIRLHKNNPEIIPDPTLEYLRYVKMTQISRFFTRTFKYINNYRCYDVLDGFGEQEIDRRCEKIPHMSCLWYVEPKIWIEVRVVFR